MSSKISLNSFSNFVVLPHSVFALPFALASFAIAAHLEGLGFGWKLGKDCFLVVLAVVSARTAAMSFNRLVDRAIDAKNPRTSTREIPAGKISPAQAKRIVVLSSVVFLLSSGLLGMHCLALAPFVLAVLLGYSVTKRFTSLAHLVLGLALGLAPGGAWWVLRPQIEPTPLLLMFAVMLWVAGFDVLYSCQDEEFDRNAGLFSIPARLGIAGALQVSRLLHFLSFLLFVVVGVSADLHPIYLAGMIIIGALLAYQHTLVRADDLSRINRAFFTTNGIISLGYFALVLTTLAL